MDAAEIVKRTSGRTRTVHVCPDAALWERWQAAEQAYEQAKRHSGGTLGDTDDVAALKADAERLRDEVDDGLVEITLDEVRPGRVRQLQADHALSRKEAERRGLRAGALDEESFWPALAAEAIVEPEFTVDQAGQLLDSSQLVRGPLIEALNDLHRVVSGDPKARVDTARRRNIGSKQTPQQS